MRTLVVELLDKGVELGLLLKQVGAGGTGGLLFQGQMHALVTAVLLRMTGADAFYADAEPQPPNGKSGQIEKPVGRSERNTIVGADRLRQTSLLKQALKGRKSGLFRRWIPWPRTAANSAKHDR